MAGPLNRRRTGIVQILMSGFCFGTLGVMGKFAYGLGLNPGEFLVFRFLLGAFFQITFLAIFRRAELKMPLRSLMACAVLGAAGYACFSSCFFIALTSLSTSLTVLLLYVYPVIVAVGAFWIYGERLEADKWLSLPLAVLGLVLLVWGDISVRSPIAIFFGLGAAVMYSAYILASRRWLRGLPLLGAAAYIQLFAGLALAVFHWRDPAQIAAHFVAAWPQLLVVALIGSATAMTLFLLGLQKLKAWEVSLLSTAEPLSAILLAAIIFGERLSWVQTLGAIAVLSAFVWLAMPRRTHLTQV